MNNTKQKNKKQNTKYKIRKKHTEAQTYRD
jgi:hypothetical protein